MKNILEKNCDNRLEILKEQFPECFDRDGNFNIQKFQEIVEPSNKVFKDSYGLNWLGKTYARKLAQLPISTVLSEDKAHNEKEENKNSENVYIKGDNLEVLRHLVSAYSEKIKMIYIDPPYNTGNGDFVYNDSRSFTEKELDKLIENNAIEENEKERILSWIDNKSSSHSAWLTFMFPRLYLARKLLKEDGVIFISIDDNEASQLKLLCDEVFGEENFIGDIIRKTKSVTNVANNGLNIQHELALIYSRNKNKIFFSGEYKDLDVFSNPDNDINGEWKSIDPTAPRDGDKYGIENPITGKIDFPPRGRAWFFSKENYEEYIKNGRIKFKEEHSKNERGFIFKRYKNELKSHNNFVNTLFGCENSYLNQVATKDIINIYGEKVFDFTKPVDYIKKLIQYSCKTDTVILDFFSGSATTAHAVMQLNAEDGGNRKYIMVQLEEEIEEGKEAYKFCKENNLPTNITSIGIERIKRAAKKIKEETNAEIDYGFKIYSVKELPNTIEENIEKFNLDTIKLFDSKLLTEEETNAILTTYKVFDGNMITENIEMIILDDSVVYKIGTILYIIDEIKNSYLIKNIIEKLDLDREFSINKIVIYGYNQTEGRYRTELCENIKTYANKKSAKIDVEVRY